jgi:hypothetical protein
MHILFLLFLQPILLHLCLTLLYGKTLSFFFCLTLFFQCILTFSCLYTAVHRRSSTHAIAKYWEGLAAEDVSPQSPPLKHDLTFQESAEYYQTIDVIWNTCSSRGSHSTAQHMLERL